MTAPEMTVEEVRPCHPLDELTRHLVALLHMEMDGLTTLEECIHCAQHDNSLQTFLADLHRQQALMLQELEPEVRKRLRPYSPSSQCEPW